tara:strand:+ start:188 stop:511 length:324 start_codon:yes stop_codon:yes gene_type:complete
MNVGIVTKCFGLTNHPKTEKCVTNAERSTKTMVKMFVLICVVWVEGSRYDGGEQKCIMHESQVKYMTLDQCRSDIPKSEQLIEGAIFDNFGEEPIGYTISPGCFGGA